MSDEVKDRPASGGSRAGEATVGSGVARIEATIRGRVQGVGFRYFVMRRAHDLGLRGWVANVADGSVQCVAEGPQESLDALVDAVHRGPTGSIVEEVSVVSMAATGGFDRFAVRSGAHRGD
jgi:acylphosphatase